MKKFNEIYIQTDYDNQLRTLLTWLVSMGCYIHHNHISVDNYMKNHRIYKRIHIDENGEITGHNEVLDIKEVYHCTNKEVYHYTNIRWMERLISVTKSTKITLNDDYTAEVFADKVEVGCQVITYEKLAEVWEANKKLRNSN